MGETPLHVCMVKDSELHLEVARIMLQLYPALSNDIYENDEYFGQFHKMLFILVIYRINFVNFF